MLPSLELLEQIQQKIQNLSNQRGESKRNIHYGCYLLGLKAGLRVSEAINFNLANKTCKGLYFVKSKGKKERFVYIPQQVISELKQNNWKPNHTNRFNFYHFLRRIKRELNLPVNIELTPHTLRRAFATYHAEAGLPLPLLQKLLGHQSIRTTALYWRNVYNDDGNDTDNILTAKNWLDQPKKPKPTLENPVQIKLEKSPEPLTPNPLTSELPLNYLSKINDLEQKLSQISQENNRLKTELSQVNQQKADLHQDLTNLAQQNAILYQQSTQETKQREQVQQDLTEAEQIINQLKQKLTTAETDLAQTKQINNSLYQQLQDSQKTIADLTQKLTQQEQNQTNLLNTYQKAIKDKELVQKQLNHLTKAIKNAVSQFHQWQKINYYQNEFKAQIVQPPPRKISK